MADGAPKAELYRAVVVTAEVIGHDISELAAEAIARELALQPFDAAMSALRKCQRELSGRLTLAAVLQRIEHADGRPGAEEAWAMCPRSEDETVVWTEETSEAFGLSEKLEDRVAARMAFREVYAKLCQEARDARRPVKWVVSMGFDPNGRGGPLVAAVEAKRLTADQARACLDPGRNEYDAIDARLRKLEGKPPAPRLLPPDPDDGGVPPEVKAFLEGKR